MVVGESGLIIVAYSVYCLIGCFSHHVIQSYHLNKPLGMQTLLTQVTILSSKSCTGIMILGAFLQVSTELIDQFPKWLALAYTLGEVYTGQMVYVIIFFVITTKYLSIYHGERLASFNDDKLLKLMKIGLFAVPTVLVAVEFLYLSDYKDMSLFQVKFYGKAKANSHLSRVSSLSTMIVFAAIATLQLRTEYDSLNGQDVKTGCATKLWACIKTLRRQQYLEQPLEDVDPDYSIATVRVLILYVIVVITVLAYQQFGGAETTKWNFLVSLSFFFNVIPLTLVVRHDRMKALAVKITKQSISGSLELFKKRISLS